MSIFSEDTIRTYRRVALVSGAAGTFFLLSVKSTHTVRDGVTCGLAVLLFGLSAFSLWLAHYVRRRLHWSADAWRALQARLRPKVFRVINLSGPAVLAAALGAFALNARFLAGALIAVSAALIFLAVSKLLGGLPEY